jgi:pimeloyl-ACP methyl ester carboxylesterase
MASPIIGRIHVVAHSIGTMLTMEALRQIYARQPTAGERIGAVVFASPDIPRHFRFTPESRHSSRGSACPFGADTVEKVSFG